MSTRVTTLPPIESHPIIFMKFTDKVNRDLLRLIIRRMQEVGLKVIEHESDDPPIIIGITTTQERLEREAQSIRLQKMRYDTRIMDVFDIEQRDKFCDTSIPYRDSFGLFSSNDRSLLVSHIIENATVLATGKKSSTLSQELDFLATPYMERNVTRFVKIHNKMRDLALDLAGVNRARHILCNILQEDGYIDIISPVHTTHGIKDDIWKDISSFRIMPPIESIREYYGEEVAFYFAWMGILTKWLCFPALFGLLATVYRWYRKDSIMSDEYTPFYGLMTFLWSVLFLKWWRRHEARLCYKWGVLVGEYEKRKYFDVRPEFYGSFRSSPVTGELELFYPEYKRLLKFIGSAIVTIAMLFIAFWTMILSLNLQGYINPKNHPERWHEGNIHPFHWPQISQLAEKGALFDMHSPWRSLIPVALHVTTISTFNAVYRVIANRLTEWENHPTELAFSNSLILKRFLFEAFDCYVGLFYLAFYERDIEKLGQELVSIFNMDTLRRVTVECIVPMIMKRFSLFMRRSTKIDKKDDSSQATKYTPLTDQANLGVYEQFDDYMEVIIQIGYVTLFASAYPLASLISVIANSIEMRSDMFKLTFLCRRPRSIRCDGLNMWKKLLECIVWLSALTNCLIFGYTSGQLREWLPSFYESDDLEHSQFRDDKGWIVMFVIFGVERLLLYLGLLIENLIPDTPEDVMNELERRHFVKEEESRKFEHQQTSRQNK